MTLQHPRRSPCQLMLGALWDIANAVNAFRTNSKTVCECDGNYEHALFPDDATELSGFTPSFLWLLRDFYLDLEEDGRKVCIIGSCTHCTLVDQLR